MSFLRLMVWFGHDATYASLSYCIYSYIWRHYDVKTYLNFFLIYFMTHSDRFQFQRALIHLSTSYGLVWTQCNVKSIFVPSLYVCMYVSIPLKKSEKWNIWPFVSLRSFELWRPNFKHINLVLSNCFIPSFK